MRFQFGFAGREKLTLVQQVVEFTAQPGAALQLGVVVTDFGAEVALDGGNKPLHLAFLRFVAGGAVGLHGHAVGVDAEPALAQGGPQVGVQPEAADERVAALDVDVDVGQSLQCTRHWQPELGPYLVASEVAHGRAVGAGRAVVGVFEQLDPQPQAADFHRIGVDIHAEQAAFDERLFFVEKRFLHPLAFGILRVVVEKAAIVVGHDQLVVDHLHPVVTQGAARAVEQDFQLAFHGDQLIERRHQKMPRTNRRVAKAQRIDEGVGLGLAEISADGVVHVVQLAVAALSGIVELLQYGAAQGLAAHIHGHEAGRKERAVAVAVDFLENQPQHRGVDERLVVFLNVLRALAAEIVGIQKREQILQRGQLPRAAATLPVFEHRPGQQRQGALVAQVADDDGSVLDLRQLEQRTVEVRHLAEGRAQFRRTLGGQPGQHLKKQRIEIVEIADFVRIQEGVIPVALVVADELRFQQFQE